MLLLLRIKEKRRDIEGRMMCCMAQESVERDRVGVCVAVAAADS